MSNAILTVVNAGLAKVEELEKEQISMKDAVYQLSRTIEELYTLSLLPVFSGNKALQSIAYAIDSSRHVMDRSGVFGESLCTVLYTRMKVNLGKLKDTLENGDLPLALRGYKEDINLEVLLTPMKSFISDVQKQDRMGQLETLIENTEPGSIQDKSNVFYHVSQPVPLCYDRINGIKGIDETSFILQLEKGNGKPPHGEGNIMKIRKRRAPGGEMLNDNKPIIIEDVDSIVLDSDKLKALLPHQRVADSIMFIQADKGLGKTDPAAAARMKILKGRIPGGKYVLVSDVHAFEPIMYSTGDFDGNVTYPLPTVHKAKYKRGPRKGRVYFVTLPV